MYERKREPRSGNLKHQSFLIFVIGMILIFPLTNIIAIDIENPLTKLGNGSTEEIILFPDGGGYNNFFNFTLPEAVTITDAEMELNGLGILGSLGQITHDFTDTVNNTAWKGVTTENPPKSNPSTFISTPFNNVENNNISRSNDVRAIYKGTGLNNYPYHLFRFNITETALNSLRVYWEGYGYFNGFMLVPYWAYLYIWDDNAQMWKHIGTNSTLGLISDFEIRSGLYSNPTDFIDSSNQLFVMAQGTGIVDANFNSWIYTDYVKIDTDALGLFYPTNPTLDVGDDGDIDWDFSGSFDQNATIDDESFKTELQSIIDSAEPGIEYVEILLNFTSTTAGRLKISNISISYELPVWNLPPELITDIPNGTYGFYEDTVGGGNLIDLNDYFWDDNDNGSLIFSILQNNDNVQAELDVDGHHLDFTSEPDYYGVCEFKIRATDKGYDGLIGGDVDLFTDSNVFTVSVWPTNDAPVIKSVGTEVIFEDETELSFKGIDGAFEDKWFNKTIIAHDIDGDSLSFSSNLTLQEPARIEISSNPFIGNAANLSIYATNNYVGILEFNITVSDDNESGLSRAQEPSGGPLSDYINLIIEVHNTNDPPNLTPIGEIICTEDQWYNFSLNATDDDLKFNDKYWFSTNITTEIDNLVDSVNYEFNELTGSVSILPDNEMVGIYWVKFEVNDKNGALDFESVKFTIKNVNDPPTPVLSWPIAGGKFNNTSKILFDGANSTDDDLIHGDSLEFQWSSNISGVLGTGSKLSKILSDVGWHEITLTITDGSNAIATDSITIQITKTVVPDDNDGDDTPKKSEKKDGYEFILIILIIIIIIVIVGIFMYLRQRKKAEAELEVDSERAELPLALPQPPLQPGPTQPIIMPVQPPVQPPMQPPLAQPMVQTIMSPLPAEPMQQQITPVQIQPESQPQTEPPTQPITQPETTQPDQESITQQPQNTLQVTETQQKNNSEPQQ